MVINAPVEDIFPLLGPIREYDWIPGWEADMIWSESGFAEEGAICGVSHNSEPLRACAGKERWR